MHTEPNDNSGRYDYFKSFSNPEGFLRSHNPDRHPIRNAAKKGAAVGAILGSCTGSIVGGTAGTIIPAVGNIGGAAIFGAIGAIAGAAIGAILGSCFKAVQIHLEEGNSGSILTALGEGISTGWEAFKERKQAIAKQVRAAQATLTCHTPLLPKETSPSDL